MASSSSSSSHRAGTPGEQESGDGSILYFAYGSNLSATQMRERCPRSAAVGLARLLGQWTWVINERGFANVVAARAAGGDGAWGVLGVLYRLDARDAAALDASEGVPWAYARRFLAAAPVAPDARPPFAPDAHPLRVLVYVDAARTRPAAPRPKYVRRMNRGIDEAAARWGLPRPYVDAVLRPFIPEPGQSGESE
ncbi:hypothetical protein GGS23DRAFT_619616 [Durotheca rogersii]|uniref:uncharacterized protein n=1 Tax=Durotheca rogersii TaxID=419775 RepID=UPI00222013BE|nr:uncharacterized protein GGS23DRAFT_619616 [Durotheca rogersii]KAI5864914.1 hypothetical protein GGS23DRAFT_619616 [Durotheca rogersii]